MLVYRPSSADPSVAEMLDDVRDLLVEAREAGERPTGLVLTPKLFRAVMTAKAREAERGNRIVLFGMELYAPDIA
jgi:hypothetical protein